LHLLDTKIPNNKNQFQELCNAIYQQSF
jgi:hypothetical protein